MILTQVKITPVQERTVTVEMSERTAKILASLLGQESSDSIMRKTGCTRMEEQLGTEALHAQLRQIFPS